MEKEVRKMANILGEDINQVCGDLRGEEAYIDKRSVINSDVAKLDKYIEGAELLGIEDLGKESLNFYFKKGGKVIVINFAPVCGGVRVGMVCNEINKLFVKIGR